MEAKVLHISFKQQRRNVTCHLTRSMLSSMFVTTTRMQVGLHGIFQVLSERVASSLDPEAG